MSAASLDEHAPQPKNNPLLERFAALDNKVRDILFEHLPERRWFFLGRSSGIRRLAVGPEMSSKEVAGLVEDAVRMYPVPDPKCPWWAKAAWSDMPEKYL